MTSASRFRINEPKITHQTLDGEVVIINFESGSYYSLGGAGAGIWQALDSGANEEEIREMLRRLYEVEPDRASACLASLLQQLRDESIIVETDRPAGQPPYAVPAESAPRAVFVEPEFRKFEDMQSLLLLDPIHEVDDRGWPSIKADVP